MKIYIIVGSIRYDVDGEYIVVKAFRKKGKAIRIAKKLEEDVRFRGRYGVWRAGEFNMYQVRECELE